MSKFWRVWLHFVHIGKKEETSEELLSILILLESCLQSCMTYTIAECKVNELLMMDRGTVRNM
jgi:hypothetical protein